MMNLLICAKKQIDCKFQVKKFQLQVTGYKLRAVVRKLANLKLEACSH